MELRVEHDATALRRPRTHGAPTLVFPLETTVIELALHETRLRLDRGGLALVPAHTSHHMQAHSPAPKVVTLVLSGDERARATREYAPWVEREPFERMLSTPHLLPRTRWVDELVHRYLFERAICERHESDAARFCETELTKELYFLGQEQSARQTRATVAHAGSTLVERARAIIEAELFEPRSTAQLARRCHASESALLRAFRRELGLPPSVYVRERRLDEALLLLQSGRYSVGEVAERVGYLSQAAFAAAFQRKFHVAPSSLRHGDPLAVLPPHGRPPRVDRVRASRPRPARSRR
jgi:AraC-like DNA-binding protein